MEPNALSMMIHPSSTSHYIDTKEVDFTHVVLLAVWNLAEKVQGLASKSSPVHVILIHYRPFVRQLCEHSLAWERDGGCGLYTRIPESYHAYRDGVCAWTSYKYVGPTQFWAWHKRPLFCQFQQASMPQMEMI